ncbi:MAG: amino acid ABC transporter substrate-binding protein [Desulfovibrio sp. S3730MH75]|nr:MAG: amino acid ABC transporter substrate-binding protein [Desulfovibrio sp. S3730MH75]
MKKIFILVSILMLIISSSAFAANKNITAVADLWPPFVDPENPKQGLSMEVVRAAYEIQGYQVTLKIVPWARAKAYVKEGVYDIIPNTWKTDARKKFLHYSNSYATNQIKFIKRKGDSFEYDGLKSLAGKTVGTIIGYGYGDAFLNDASFRREDSPNLITNIKKLVINRLDLVLEDEIAAKAIIAKEDSSLFDKIVFGNNTFSGNDLYVTCGLKNPRHKELIDAFNKGLKEIKSNGTYKKIFEGYGM